MGKSDTSSNSYAIVAIPSQTDYVWRVSSEKVPHLTLLFLGDKPENVNVPRVEDFLGHVVNTTMHRFGMDVERRDTLGDKKADVLFFGNHNRKKIEALRAQLLINLDIRRPYNAATQFPLWTPHLTMGYPETPAKPDKREYPGFSWVNFDRIALWTGDYAGTEFLLKEQEFGGGEVNMSDNVDDILAHFGVPGMKWGVKRSQARLNSSSHDFQNAHAAKVKAKTGGGHRALSNKELQDLVTRINLEKQYTKLNPSKLVLVGKVLKGIFNTGKTVNDVISFVNSPTGKLVKEHISKLK